MSGQTNSSPVKKNSAFMETVQDKLKDIKNFSNWSAKEQMVAVGAVGMIFGAMLPILAVALPVAATGAIVALTLFFAVKAVEYTFKGLKWSAEKTVDGAKYTAEKVKDASTYAAGKIRDGAVHAKDKVKEGTSRALDRSGSFLKEAAHSSEYSMKSEFVQELLEQKGIKKMVNNTIEIIKAKNSSVPPTIKSAIKSAIDSKAGELKGKYVVDSAGKDRNLEVKNDLEKQSRIVDRLEEILTKNILDMKELEFVIKIFSKNQDKIEGILDDYNKNPEKYPKQPTTPQRIARSVSSSFSSLGRKGSEQSNSLSKSNSLNSIGTESTATVSDSDSQDFATVRRSNSSSSLSSASPKLIPVDPLKVPESPPFDSGRSSFGPSTPTSSLGKLEQSSRQSSLSNRNGSDSGFSSPTSSPVHAMCADEDGKVKTQADLNQINHTLWVQPSTKMDEVKPESTQVKTVG